MDHDKKEKGSRSVIRMSNIGDKLFEKKDKRKRKENTATSEQPHSSVSSHEQDLTLSQSYELSEAEHDKLPSPKGTHETKPEKHEGKKDKIKMHISTSNLAPEKDTLKPDSSREALGSPLGRQHSKGRSALSRTLSVNDKPFEHKPERNENTSGIRYLFVALTDRNYSSVEI